MTLRSHFLLACAITLLLGASAGQCRDISFQSIAKAAPLGSEPPQPILYIATSVEDAERFLPWLEAEHQKAVRANDWGERVVVAVFRGAVGTNGFGITVRRLRVEHDRLRLIVVFHDPPPQSMARPAFTTPYHIIALPKRSFATSMPASWILENSQRQILAQKP